MRLIFLLVFCLLLTGCSIFSGTGIKQVKVGGSYSIDGVPVNGDITFVFDDPKGSNPKSQTPEIRAILPNGAAVYGYFITQGEVGAAMTIFAEQQRKLHEIQQQTNGINASNVQKQPAKLPASMLTSPNVSKFKAYLKKKMGGG